MPAGVSIESCNSFASTKNDDAKPVEYFIDSPVTLSNEINPAQSDYLAVKRSLPRLSHYNPQCCGVWLTLGKAHCFPYRK